MITTAETNNPGFVRDTRGAVLFIGLFMACFLAGGLWSLIGIGNTIVHRELAQEAADSAAFSSAVIHAKGMNLVGFLNLFMLMMTSIYVILAIIVDILLIAAVVAAFTVVGIPAALRLVGFANKVDNAAKYYMKVAEPVMTVSAYGQTAIARIAPFAGAAAAYKMGKTYKISAISVSPAMLGGTQATGAIAKATALIARFASSSKVLKDATASVGNTLGTDSDKIGLPVKSMQMSVLCKNVTVYVVTEVSRLFAFLPSNAQSKAAWVLGVIGAAFGATVEILHCQGGKRRDAGTVQNFFRNALNPVRAIFSLADFYVFKKNGFWGDPDVGPKIMSADAKNGHEQMGVYAITREELKDEDDRRKVTVLNSASKKQLPVVSAPPSPIYNAKAEFYWDCEYEWKNTPYCNGDRDDEFPLALYGMRWRARLIRATRPGDVARGLVQGGLESNIPGPSKAGGWRESLITWITDKVAAPSYH
jgi:hypothetical protein